MTTLTSPLLSQIMNCPQSRADECFPNMIAGMRQFGISTPAGITCFLTQCKWESGGLVYFAELADGTAYEGRADLGNTQPGDGPAYKGAGPIQVTGRDNFTAANTALHAAGLLPASVDIVANPDAARTVQYGFLISCWWWQAHGGNTVAERQPLSYASLCCGRLVNRGDADSQYQAQDEAQRVDAFSHVNSFGQLSLPGATPVTPTPPEEDMSAQDVSDIKASISKLQQSVDALRSYSNELPNRINQSNGSSQTQALIGNLRTFLDELPTRVVNAIKAGK